VSIPETDLAGMANIGAQVTSKETYATVKLALNDADAGYADKQYKVFLQGSYGNDTNILKESDVDVVIRLDSIFTYDIDNLPPDQQADFKSKHPAATYTYVHFREHVLKVLTDRFGDDVVPGTKAVQIKPRNNRRKADVLIATQHKKYSWYAPGDERQLTGISFHKSDGTRVRNYPTQHRDNLVTKNQGTNEWFKHIVRIFKNGRQKLIERGAIENGVAPSYYVEGLLYNVPNDKFGTSYVDSVVNAINWLNNADRSTFVCANEQYRLLDGNADVTWNATDCDAYLNGLVGLWNDW
jgi:hypothetical protein